MITHSDNTATDAALAADNVDKMHALIAEAGLGSARTPNKPYGASPLAPRP